VGKLKLTIAVSHYDHVIDLLIGQVRVEGAKLTYLDLPLHDIFLRAIDFGDFDIAEMSFAKYVSMRSQGDDRLIALPVFPARVARHSSIYVRRGGPIKTPADLAGRRVGVPEWAQTAAVYTRGMLADDYGVDLASIAWFQAGQDEAGRGEKVALALPKGLSVTPVPDRSLSELLVAGDLDAVLAARPIPAYRNKHPDICRLFENFAEVEKDYVRRTKIFPIMHTIVVRKALLDEAPWLAANLFTAFEEAKRRSIARVSHEGVPMVPIPWALAAVREAKSVLGDDYFPYGVAANKPTLDAFLRWAYEQGVCHRHLAAEDLFPPQTQISVKI
jgi:4,5-dihydroxyphthalate decarboxylase